MKKAILLCGALCAVFLAACQPIAPYSEIIIQNNSEIFEIKRVEFYHDSGEKEIRKERIIPGRRMSYLFQKGFYGIIEPVLVIPGLEDIFIIEQNPRTKLRVPRGTIAPLYLRIDEEGIILDEHGN
jgi:hypothetical protein